MEWLAREIGPDAAKQACKGAVRGIYPYGDSRDTPGDQEPTREMPDRVEGSRLTKRLAVQSRGMRSPPHALYALAALLTGTLLIAVGTAGLAAARTIVPPAGLPPVAWPADNPYTPEKASLGRLLFFDRRLSSDGTVSCSSCHLPERAFTDGKTVSAGIGGKKGSRNAPSLINRAYGRLQFWDGRSPTLEAQVLDPIADALEMTSETDRHVAHRACLERLRSDPVLARRFATAFRTPGVTLDRVAKAVATFERTLLSGSAPFDRHRRGDPGAMTPQQVRGMDLFLGRAGCSGCHMGFNFSDGAFVNTGIGMDRPSPDIGRERVSGSDEDRGAFKVPGLREVALTAPYMHDGSIATLAGVIEHYNRGGVPNANLDPRMKPLGLTAEEKQEIEAFLRALSGEGWQHVAP